MPIYEYQCPTCSTTFDILRPMAQDKEPGICPDCGTESPRKVSRTNFALKGGGWARDGYQGKGGGGSTGGRRPKPVADTSSLPYVDRSGGLRDAQHNPLDPKETFGLP